MNKRLGRPRQIRPVMNCQDLSINETTVFLEGIEYHKLLTTLGFELDINEEIMPGNIARIKDTLLHSGIAFDLQPIEVGQNTRWVLTVNFE